MQIVDDEGLVHLTEKGDPPLFLPCGDRFMFTEVPEGTRVLYARPPLAPLPDLRAAIARAIDNPVGKDPLNSYLKPGMKVTIAFDDISLSLPLMQQPDCRQVCKEVLLERLADAGVTDVHLIVAVCMHRHMHDFEVREQVGRKIFKEYWPDRLYNGDVEDPEGNVVLGQTEEGDLVEINKRAAESDLLIYVSLVLTALNGGHKAISVGLGTYNTVRQSHRFPVNLESRSFNDPPRSALHHVFDRIGRYVEKHVNCFHIEMTVNSDTFPWYAKYQGMQERHWGFMDRVNARISKHSMDLMPLSVNRRILHTTRAPYGVTYVKAGDVDQIHPETLENVYKQQLIRIQGQSDIVIYPIPFVMPYSVNAIMNPILLWSMGLGYMFNFYKNKPLVKKGGTIIFTHTTVNKFDPVHHPSYIELWDYIAQNPDNRHIDDTYGEKLARDPKYIDMYRHHNAYHGFHAVSMWNWGAHGWDHAGQVILVGALDKEVPRRMRWETADSVMEAIEMGRSKHGADAGITVNHSPPIAMWEVDGEQP